MSELKDRIKDEEEELEKAREKIDEAQEKVEQLLGALDFISDVIDATENGKPPPRTSPLDDSELVESLERAVDAMNRTRVPENRPLTAGAGLQSDDFATRMAAYDRFLVDAGETTAALAAILRAHEQFVAWNQALKLVLQSADFMKQNLKLLVNSPNALLRGIWAKYLSGIHLELIERVIPLLHKLVNTSAGRSAEADVAAKNGRALGEAAITAVLQRATEQLSAAIAEHTKAVSAREERWLVLNQRAKDWAAREAQLKGQEGELGDVTAKLESLERALDETEAERTRVNGQITKWNKRRDRLSELISDRKNFNCGSPSAHKDPFERDAKGDYKCREATSRDARERWRQEDEDYKECDRELADLRPRAGLLRKQRDAQKADILSTSERRDRLRDQITAASLVVEATADELRRDIAKEQADDTVEVAMQHASAMLQRQIRVDQSLIELQSL